MARTEWRLSHVSPGTDMNGAGSSQGANNEPRDLDRALEWGWIKGPVA